MNRRELGSSGLTISPIGLGTWAIAGQGWEYSWGAQDDAQSLVALERASELGVNWIEGIEAAIDALERLKAAGKIRALGVSNFDVAQLERARAVAEIASLQPPYSLLMRGVEDEILPYCESRGIAVLAYSTLQSGLLTGSMTRDRIANLPDDDWRKTRSADFREPRLSRVLALVDLLRSIGARRPAQIDELIKAADFELSSLEVDEIEKALPEASNSNVPEPA